jgi:hypothetical protein
MIERGSRLDRKMRSEDSVLDRQKIDLSTPVPAATSGRDYDSFKVGQPEHGENGPPAQSAPKILRLIAQYMAVLTVERASSEHTVRAY